MMAARYATVAELRSTGRMVQILIEAGYNPSNDHEMNLGMTAYEAALVVCTYASPTPPVRQAQRTQPPRAGRNDPCPCGSGKKYKKCCIDLDRAPLAANDSGPLIKFGPDVVPRLWDANAVSEDIERLSLIMDRDPAFADIGYSTAGIGAFMDRVSEKEPALFKALTSSDCETSGPAIDDLADLFCRECSDLDYGRGIIKERCLEAAKRATSGDEVRALTAGICLALIEPDDPANDALADLLFRKALFATIGHVSIINRVLDRVGDVHELRRLIAANDPSFMKKLQSLADELSASETDLLRTDFERSHGRLWDTIVADEFPVPLPFAAQMAVLGQIAALASGGKTPPKDDVFTAIRAFSNDLLEEDYALYGRMLYGWLEENKERSSRIVDDVKMMRHLCMTGSIGDLAPPLFARCLQNARFVAFDAEEQKFIDSSLTAADLPAFAVEYGMWLKAKGYPGMAERLVRFWEGVDSFRAARPDRDRHVA